MTPSQWDKANELFHAASKLPPAERDAYLIEVCPEESILHEVHSLLANASGDDFLSVGPERFIGKTLCHYRITDYIGHGSMGDVYKAQDTKLDRLVALKFLPPDLKNDPRGFERLVREAKSASALNHPHIVVVHAIDHDTTEKADFIVMEYVPGNTLGSIIRAGGAVPAEQARRYAIEVAGALAAAHRKDILHGDLKPANIMINDEGLVKLLDFGLARARNRELSDPAKSELFGTTAYMAPERIGLPLIDPRSEIFSLGVVLYEMLSGEHPFGTRDREEMAKAIHDENPKPLSSGIPVWLADIVDCCLEKHPAQRFQTMQDVLSALKQQERPGGISPRSPTRSPADVDQVHAIAGRITYSNVAKSRKAVNELTDLFKRGLSEAARETAILALKDIILTLDQDRSGVSGTIRKVRKLAMEGLKLFTSGELGRCFEDGDLEGLDLYQMDLSGAQFASTSFRDCFLVEVSFRGSNLAESSFGGAFVRNVDFTDADLSGADFSDIDWFNAIGLTEKQLHSVQRNTLKACPPDVPGMHRVLDARYGFSFDSWTRQVQDQLKAAWTEYLKPAGLRHVVAAWRGNPR